MAKVDYKQSYAWQEAIKLGKEVLSLIETLPDTALPLAQRLAALMIQIPAEIAGSLVEHKPAVLSSVLELDSAIELIDSVYPALDTADAKRGAEQLLERLESARLTELVAPVVEESTDDHEKPQDEEEDQDEDEDEDEEEAPSTSVSVSEE